MKTKYKNIIMLVTIVILGTLIVLTMYYAKDNLASKSSNNMIDNEIKNNLNNTDDNNNEPPEKPDDENSEKGEPPEKPDGDMETNTDDSSSNDNNMLEKPDDDNKPDMMTTAKSELTTIYYVVFVIENLLFVAVLLYLIMSKFNKKNIKETFISGDKVMIYILLIIILTGGFTYGEKFVTEELFLNNDTDIITKGDDANTANNITYSANTEITSSKMIVDEDYESTDVDENAVLVNGDIEVSITNSNINKTGDSNGGDNTSFYGTNSAVLAKSGATLTLDNITVNTDATGSNGIFSYGGSATTNNSTTDNTTIEISDSTITTSKDNSGGIMVSGGGILNATNLTVTTAGTSSAAIRSDRGGGTMTVNKGTYTTTGKGSPAVYSTADITVSNATLIAKKSEGIVIEGNNSVTLDSCELTDSNTELNGKSTTYKNIFLYQSMSGDAANGTSEFTAKGSKIITNNGDTFYVTNTSATINLENNTFINNDSDGNFLRVKSDSWGNDGENGGNVTLNMNNQEVTGNIVIDSISTLNMNMETNSYYEGTINGDNIANSITLTLDSTSKIKLTGDSYITDLIDSDTTYSNIDFNGYKLYVNGIAIN